MAISSLEELGARARIAARELAKASSATKADALKAAAEALEKSAPAILEANERDVERASAAGADATMIDRLRLDVGRITSMADGLRSVAALPDPVGELVEGYVRPNGLRIKRVRVPLGVVGLAYENRPDCTSDAAPLCLMSGNAALLRGSAGAIDSNNAFAGTFRAWIEGG